MPRKPKPKVAEIFQDNGSGYIVESIQKPSLEEIETIEKPSEKEKIEEKEVKKQKPGEYTLIICEKPQAAMKIAYALSETNPQKRNIGTVPYWEIEREGKKFVVASAVGHLFGLWELNKTNNWPVFDIGWRESIGFMKKYSYVLEQLSRNASDYIIATDYDVEGELIGFNVLRFLCSREDARRMKFSTLTKYDLNDSFKDMMEHPDYGQAFAGEARHYLDWFYGINLSRALMQAIKQAGGYKILSIGRVQGPSLNLIVEREKEISAFKPQAYWQVFLDITNSHEIEVKYIENIKDKNKLEEFEKLKGKQGEAKTTKQEKEMWPWPPFDLTSLQIESYKYFGLSPAQTLAIAQKLYLAGLISYPRTSSQKLPFSLGLKRILDRLKEEYPKFANLLTRTKPVEGLKTDPAHPAIFPTGETSDKLTLQEKQLYELIVKRFLSCFADNALIEEKKINVKVEGFEFLAEGKHIIKKGWLEIYPARIELREIPDVNGKIKVKDVRIEEKETQPPRRYNPSSLISELEKRELGTKATRASIIDTLYKRGYITGSQIQATQLGMSVALALEKNCPMILDEQLTRNFEEEMEKIKEEKSKEKMLKREKKVIEDAKKVLIKIAEQFKKHEQDIGKVLLEAHYEAQEKEREMNTLFECPACHKGKLVIKRSRFGKRFLACNKYPECKTTFPLPQFGLIKLSEKKCECGWPMLLLIRKGKPPWNFCINPECYIKKARAEVKEQRETVKKEKVKLAKKKARKKAKLKKEKEDKEKEREEKQEEKEKEKEEERQDNNQF